MIIKSLKQTKNLFYNMKKGKQRTLNYERIYQKNKEM